MNDLIDLEKFFTSCGYKVSENLGYSLKIGKDTWTMAHGVYYKNLVPVTEKEIREAFTKKPKKTKS